MIMSHWCVTSVLNRETDLGFILAKQYMIQIPLMLNGIYRVFFFFL